MAEPTTTTAASVSLTVLAVTLLGPTAGPWLAIAAAAFAGSLWPLSGARTYSGLAAAALLVRCMTTARVLTGLIAGFVERLYAIPVSEGLAPVAMAIAAMGNGWRPVFAIFGGWIGDRARAATEKDQ